MLVLCGWRSPKAIGAIMVEARSLSTLIDDFYAEAGKQVEKWNAQLESILRCDDFGANYDEPGWSPPANAKLTWYLPQEKKVEHG